MTNVINFDINFDMLHSRLIYPISVGGIGIGNFLLNKSDVDSLQGRKLSNNLLNYCLTSLVKKKKVDNWRMECAHLPPTDFDAWPKNKMDLWKELNQSIDFKNQTFFDSTIKTKLFFPINHFDDQIVVAFLTDKSAKVITEIYVPSTSSCQDIIEIATRVKPLAKKIFGPDVEISHIESKFPKDITDSVYHFINYRLNNDEIFAKPKNFKENAQFRESILNDLLTSCGMSKILIESILRSGTKRKSDNNVESSLKKKGPSSKPLSSNINTNLQSNLSNENTPNHPKCIERPTVSRSLFRSELSPLNISHDSPSDNLSGFTKLAFETPPNSSSAMIEPSSTVVKASSTVVKASFELSNDPENWNNKYIYKLFKHYQKKGISAKILMDHALETFSILENMEKANDFVVTTIGSSSYLKKTFQLYELNLIDADALWEGVRILKLEKENFSLKNENTDLKYKLALKDVNEFKAVVPLKNLSGNSKFYKFGASTYLKLPNTTMKSERSIRHISSVVMDTASVLTSHDEEKMVDIFQFLMKKQTRLFVEAAIKSECKELNFPKPLTAPQTSALLRKTVKTNYASRQLRAELKKNEINILAPVREVERYEKTIIDFYDKDANLKKCKLPFKENVDGCPTLVHRAAVLVVNVKDLISQLISDYLAENNLTVDSEVFKNDWGGVVPIVISGDHGGGSMKYFIQCLDGQLRQLGFYLSTDSYYNQALFLNPIYEELKKIQQDGVIVGGHTIKIRYMGKGDMKQAYLILGLSGQGGTYPNKQDIEPASHNKLHIDGSPHNPDFCFLDGIKLRSSESLDRCYEENVKRNGIGNTIVNAKDFFNVKHLRLIPVESPYDLVPGILHFTLDIALRIHRKERELLDEDEISAKMRKDAEDEILKSKKKFNEAKDRATKLNDEVFLKRSLINRMKKKGNRPGLNFLAALENGSSAKVNNNFFVKVLNRALCHSCLITKYDFDICWRVCSKCHKHFHLYCLAYTYHELEQKEDSLSENCCNECKGREFDIDGHTKELETKKSLYRQAELEAAKLKTEMESLESKIEQFKAPELIEYDKRVKALNIDIQAQYGGVITGNHCTKFLDHHEELVELLKPSEIKNNLIKLVEIVQEIKMKLHEKKFWTDIEIQEFKPVLNEYGVLFPLIFKCMTPKMHEIIFHVIPFLQKFRTIGYFNEEDTEKAHHICNDIARPLACMRDSVEKLTLIFKRWSLAYANSIEMPNYGKSEKSIALGFK